MSRVYNADMIRTGISIRDVLEHFGYEGYGNKNIKCPVLATPDKHPSAHIYDKPNNICMCFSCGHPHNVIDITMAQTGLDFQGAMDYLADNFDLTGMYYDTDEDKQKPFPLTRKQLIEIGLKPTDTLVRDYNNKPIYNWTIYNLWKDEEPVFLCMVAGKIEEATQNKVEYLKALKYDYHMKVKEIEAYEQKIGKPVKEIYQEFYDKYEQSGFKYQLDRTSDEYKAIYSMIKKDELKDNIKYNEQKLLELLDLRKQFPLDKLQKECDIYTENIIKQEQEQEKENDTYTDRE